MAIFYMLGILSFIFVYGLSTPVASEQLYIFHMRSYV